MLERLQPVQKTGQVASWTVKIPWENQPPVVARLCVIRKSKAAIAAAIKKLERRASKQGSELRPETLVYAEHVRV